MSDAFSVFDPVDDLVDGFLERYRRGERPSLSEYTEKHPELAERICALFPALLVMEELGSRAAVREVRSKTEPGLPPECRNDWATTSCSAASGRAGWASCTKRSRNHWDGTWHSRHCLLISSAMRRGSSDSAVRRGRLPGCTTRTSCRCLASASTTACIITSCSSSGGRGSTAFFAKSSDYGAS